MKISKLNLIRNLCGYAMPDLDYRNMLDCISIGDYISSKSTATKGTVKKIYRSRFGVPVCVKIRDEDGRYDMVSIDRIDLWNERKYSAPDANEY